MALSFLLALSAATGLPQKHGNLQNGAKVPHTLGFQNLSAVFAPVSLRRDGMMPLDDSERGLENSKSG
jgi:hypothetical protein